MNSIIKLWWRSHHAGFALSAHSYLDTLLFADDQIIIATSEDDLQHAAYNLQQVVSDFGFQISTDKTKVMAFKGKYPIPSKICIRNTLIEHVVNVM